MSIPFYLVQRSLLSTYVVLCVEAVLVIIDFLYDLKYSFYMCFKISVSYVVLSIMLMFISSVGCLEH